MLRVVGANGSGKTTLLNILGSTEDPTEGAVSVPKRLRLGVLRQDHFLYEDEPILGVAVMGNPELWRAMVEREALIAKEDRSVRRRPVLGTRGDLPAARRLHRGGSRRPDPRGSRLSRRDPPPAPLDPLRRLQAPGAAGADPRGAPDVLLLDEPTNHLDILSIRWLEKFLREFKGRSSSSPTTTDSWTMSRRIFSTSTMRLSPSIPGIMTTI